MKLNNLLPNLQFSIIDGSSNNFNYYYKNYNNYKDFYYQ